MQGVGDEYEVADIHNRHNHTAAVNCNCTQDEGEVARADIHDMVDDVLHKELCLRVLIDGYACCHQVQWVVNQASL